MNTLKVCWQTIGNAKKYANFELDQKNLRVATNVTLVSRRIAPGSRQFKRSSADSIQKIIQ